jgi:hypothetical protein
MTTAKENEVVNIIRAMEAEYMRLMAERECDLPSLNATRHSRLLFADND